MTTLRTTVHTRHQAHAAVSEVYQQIRDQGGVWTIEATTNSRRKKLALRGALHGYLLADVAEQVRCWDAVSGRWVRYAPLVWKEFFRSMFIPDVLREYTVRKTGEVKVRWTKRSTEDLSDDEYEAFLLQLQAFAVMELNVTFTEEDR